MDGLVCARPDTGNNENDVRERLGELEQANFELQQKQLEFEREKYDLHKQIARLQRKLEKRTNALIALPEARRLGRASLTPSGRRLVGLARGTRVGAECEAARGSG
jgi:predicted nuclease with TOPRIM domain